MEKFQTKKEKHEYVISSWIRRRSVSMPKVLTNIMLMFSEDIEKFGFHDSEISIDDFQNIVTRSAYAGNNF